MHYHPPCTKPCAAVHSGEKSLGSSCSHGRYSASAYGTACGIEGFQERRGADTEIRVIGNLSLMPSSDLCVHLIALPMGHWALWGGGGTAYGACLDSGFSSVALGRKGFLHWHFQFCCMRYAIMMDGGARATVAG